jgi:septum formation protein
MSLVLASASAIRRAMLDSAGVAVEVVAAAVDETTVKSVHRGDDIALARALAEAKALDVAFRLSGKWVIGGDSVVSVDGRRYGKPSSRDEAAAHLSAFSGKTMILSSAAALARDSRLDWSHGESVTLAVRQLSDTFIHNYLEREWPAVGNCVGVFRMEGPGVQLFDRVEGSHFTVLGLPLLPLLGALRQRGLIEA